jgi:hypothetical protein
MGQIADDLREYMLAKLSLSGSKKRIRRAMEVLDEAMDADRAFVIGEELRTAPDHRVRLMAVGIVGSFYGLEAPKENKIDLNGRITVDLEGRLREAIEKAHGPSSPE